MPYVHAVVPIKPPPPIQKAPSQGHRVPWDSEVDLNICTSGICASECGRPIIRHLKIDGNRGEEPREKG
jgi:hypothetical protein